VPLERLTVYHQPTTKADSEEDDDVMNWLEKGIEHLAPFVLAIECLVDPEAIFLGGRYPDVVIRYIKERLETALPPLRYEEGMAHPKLYCATAGENATAMGVATLPMYSSFAPIPEILMKHAYHPGIDAQALGG
jgi:predicted NBD/HSP70 family sugar kinase